MDYKQAIDELNKGNKVKLPEWHGHWFMVEGSVKVFTASGDVLETPFLEDYKNRTDWEITDGSRDFGGAIKAAKAGKKVARVGWNGNGMYAVIMPGYPDGISINSATAKSHGVDEGTVMKFRPYWALKTAQNDIATWAPSGSDTLAEDWIVL